jgi:hypothetical protein
MNVAEVIMISVWRVDIYSIVTPSLKLRRTRPSVLEVDGVGDRIGELALDGVVVPNQQVGFIR